MRRSSQIQKHIFILDTNVLLFDPNALQVFDEHDLMIPITVIEEIDRFKKDLNEVGRNARMVSRALDALRKKGSLSEGVALGTGGRLWVQLPSSETSLPHGLKSSTNDNIILQMALRLTKRHAPGKVVLVTRDTNMRIKADALGIPAEDYAHAHLEVEETFSGFVECEVSAETIDEVYGQGWCEPNSLALVPNQFVIFRSIDNPKQMVLTRFHSDQNRLIRLKAAKENVWGIQARNKEQLFALSLLLDPTVEFVTLTGMAGTGKTLLAIAAGLHLSADEKRYRRLVVSRPIFPLGRDLGFLPGDVSEKLNPWMKPIFDNLEFLLGGEKDSRSGPAYQPLLDQRMLEVEPLTYIRGRSMPKQYLIVDEAQNLTPHEVKTVISRAGEGTKVVLTGDPYQIDNPYVDATSNGLSYVVERFKNSAISGHVTLKKGERSKLAELAAKLL
jgi:PhoH-like ATPase